MSEKTYFDKVADICIAKGAPEGWTVSVSQLLGTYPNYTHYQIDGAVYEPLLKGPRKGRPNFKKPVDGTKRQFIFEADEFRKAIP